MLTRREMILGGALTLVWGNCACAQSSAHDSGIGCMIDSQQAESLLARASEPQSFSDASEKLISSTGDRDFDYALAQTLSRLTDMFGVLPGFSFYDDAKGAGAYATNATRMKRSDGTVLFGRRYFLNAMQQQDHPEAYVMATCAHEFGHIVQYKYNLQERLTRGQPNVKRLELQADFFAGYFAGARKLQKPDFPAAVFAASRYSVGDFETNRDHHGTPEERAAAVVRGFETSFRERRTFADAIAIGINYVQRL